jgi:hypothetical protein
MKRKRTPETLLPGAHRLSKLLHEVRALKVRFDRAHADGMKALDNHDFDALTQAIARERVLI